MPKISRGQIDKSVAARAVADRLKTTIRTTPLGVMAMAGIAFFQVGSLPSPLVNAIPTVSYLILFFGLAITACFNRSRAFFVLFVLFLSQVGLAVFDVGTADNQLRFYFSYSIISLLIPLNLLFFSSVGERGIFTPWGKRHFLMIFLQGIFAVLLISSGNQVIFDEICRKFIPTIFLSSTPIPDVAAIIFCLVGFLLLAKRRRSNAHFKMSVLGALIAVAAAHHFYYIPIAIPLFYGAAGLVILFAVMQDYYSMAYLDELTGLPSRRALSEAMLKLDGNYVIAMVDVDFFKKFNDTYGHDTGDDVLRIVARMIKECRAGKSFRYGGEEFTILFPGKRIAEALPHLEQLRERIARRRFILRGDDERNKIAVTVSIGVAESCRDLAGTEEVLKEADNALYRAKNSGRNCVSC